MAVKTPINYTEGIYFITCACRDWLPLFKISKSYSKLHQVFERSFDCKEITSQYFFKQKLSYIHNNPYSGAWELVQNSSDYLHSSARYYSTGEQGIYFIMDQ